MTTSNPLITPLHGPDHTPPQQVLYSGEYEFNGERYLWSINSTIPVLEIRPLGHHDSNTPEEPHQTWIKVSKDTVALVNKAYFSNPRCVRADNGNKVS